MTESEVTQRIEQAQFLVNVAQDGFVREVGRLRGEGATWPQIAAAMGVTPQAVQQRFGRDVAGSPDRAGTR